MMKVELAAKLSSIGANHTSFHANGTHVWVCPFYMTFDRANELIDYCVNEGLTLPEVNTKKLSEFSD